MKITRLSWERMIQSLTDGIVNFYGKYILNEQTTTNMMSKGTVYRFDGVDDKIVVPDSANWSFGDGTTDSPFTFHWQGVMTDATAFYFIEKFDTAGNDEYILATNNSDLLGIRLFDDSVNKYIGQQYQTAMTSYEGKEMSITVTYDGSGVSSGITLYINGLPITSTDWETGSYVAMEPLSADIIFGESGGLWSDGVFARVVPFNLEMTAAEVKDLISGNIPFKWQYGSQTDLIPQPLDFTSDWLTQNSGSIDGVDTFSASGGSGGVRLLIAEKGKRQKFRLAGTLTGAGTLEVKLSTGSPVQNIATGLSGTFDNTYEFTANDDILNNYLFINLTTDGDSFTATSAEYIQLGAVALYDQTSISSTTWYDKAGNSDGAVTGAEVLNAPSVTPLSCLRGNTFRIQPGGTAGTNLNVTSVASPSFNTPAISNATNMIADTNPFGSFALSADGKNITLNLTQEIVGVLCCSIIIHDINSSSTSEMYVARMTTSGGNGVIQFFKRGSTSAVSLLTIFDAGDSCDFNVAYVTSS
jgi:hypothetical protein